VSAFGYRGGELWVEEVPVREIAEGAGTPVYIYSASAIEARVRDLQRAFGSLPVRLCYAVKANPHLAVLRLLARLGMGAETVSGGEIERALAAGIPPERIVFSGVGKEEEELRFAIARGVLQINVESRDELRLAGALAREMGRSAAVALRINPAVEASTHEKIQTGREGDKFGIPIAEAREAFLEAQACPGLVPVGLHVHVGSQILDIHSFARSYGIAAELFETLRADGVPLVRLDLGGGFGIPYRPEDRGFDLDGLAALLEAVWDRLRCELILEPGRLVVGEAGVLLTRVLARKERGVRRWLVVDAGMHTLLRPALYDAWHGIRPVREPASAQEWEEVEVVGPICESGDVLGRGRRLPVLQRGDLVVLEAVGAYGATMASSYNSRPRAAEVLVRGRRWDIIKPRRPARAEFADERVPSWIEEEGPAGEG